MFSSLFKLRRRENPALNPVYSPGDIIRANLPFIGAGGYGMAISPEEYYKRTGNEVDSNRKPDGPKYVYVAFAIGHCLRCDPSKLRKIDDLDAELKAFEEETGREISRLEREMLSAQLEIVSHRIGAEKVREFLGRSKKSA